MLVQSSMAVVLPSPPPHLNPTSPAKKPASDPIYPDHHNTHLLSLLDDRSSLIHLKQIHAQALRTSSYHNNHHHPRTISLLTRLLYHASSSDFNYASRIFTQLPSPNSFAWNALIRACANSPLRKSEAFAIYREMITADFTVMPDKHTFPFVLKACAYLSSEKEGMQAHAQLLKLGLGSDVYVNNSLVHFYASCGLLDHARKVFNEMPERTLVSWNAMIDALVRCGEFEPALKLFVSLQEGGVFEPDAYTMQSVVSACAGLGAVSLGMWVHAYLLKNCDREVTDNVPVNTSVVDMYCKCGMLDLARQVFDKMPRRDVNSWNTMILGLASHGKGVLALACFRVMVEEEKISPNSITFVGVLSACSHSGMVKEGRVWFDLMIKDYKIKPRLEHYGCFIDMLARAGFLDEALDVVSEMPMKPDGVIWRSLLDACCRQNGEVKLSEEIAEKILADSEGSRLSGDYVLLSRVYASAARWDEVGLIRKMMVDQGVAKEPGCSSIEVDGVNHEFFAGDTSHPRREEIYQFLEIIEERLRLAGYNPDVSEAQMIDEGDEAKRKAVRLHSERFAIAFGLMNKKQGDVAPIRVFKNLRVCRDCHEVTKLISRVFGVEIVVRDRARFHHFKDGVCSCTDYW